MHDICDICDDVALLYNTSFLRWIPIFGVYLDHRCVRWLFLLHHWRVTCTIGEHRLVVMIFIELKAQEKRTAINASVTWRGAPSKDVWGINR